MRVVTANIKSNPVMRQSYVVSDVAAVRDTGGIILWQEIAPQRYKDALHGEMPNREHVALGTEVPITFKPWIWSFVKPDALPDLTLPPADIFPKGYVPVRAALRMHGGRSLVTPARYVTYAILVRGESKPVVWMNTHMISSAWSNRHPLTKAWRRARWDMHFDKQRRLVGFFVKRGLTVVGGGDMNRGTMPTYHSGQRWLAQGGIDHLYCVEATGGARVRLTTSSHMAHLHTDHSPRVANLAIS